MRYVSQFSGVEAATLAWGPLGWEAMAFGYGKYVGYCRNSGREVER